MSTAGEKYVCPVCVNPPGVRESARYIYDQRWLKDGRMAEFSCVEQEPNAAAKARIMKATNDLIADLHGVIGVIESVNREIYVAQHGSEPELSHWKTDPNNAEHGFPSAAGEDFRHSSDKAHPTVSAAALTSIATCAADEGVRPENGTKSLGERIRTSTGPTDDPLTEDGVLRTGSTDPESSSKLETPRSDLSVRSLTEVPAISDKSTSGAHYPSEKPGSTDFHKVKNEDAENPANATAVPASSRTPTVIQPVPSTSSATADSRVRNGTSVVGDVDLPSVDSNTSPLSESFQPSETPQSANGIDAAVDTVGACQQNLLRHISEVQDGIDERLTMIEKQVAALESGEGSAGGGDTLRDLPRVKKTLRQLLGDLKKVAQIAQMSA